jgi:hypothetical protein
MPLNTVLKSEVGCLGWLASIAVCLFLIAGPVLVADGGTTDSQSLDSAELIEDVNVELGLDASTVFSLDAGQTAGTSGGLAVPIEGELYTLDLQPQSVRANTYQLVIQAADGTYRNVEPGKARTLRGTVVEIDGSAVAASMVDGGLRARIILPDGTIYWIEPIGSRVASAGPGDHAVYREEDVIPDGGTCMALHPPIGLTANETEAGSVAAAGLAIAEIAIDADYDYYLDFQWDDDPVAATEAQINEVINAINVQYERDVGIRHVITAIIIRTAEPDPYDDAVTDAGDLLVAFKQHWFTTQGHINRDIAQLFTGKNLDGGTIGIAWVGVICNTAFGYSVVESNCCSNFACTTDLSAHELGHNWDAVHCSCPGWTMNPTIQCANRFHETYTIPDISDHRNTRTCLDEGDELRRVIVSADSSTVLTDDTLQFTAVADFRFGDDLDITSEATWSIDRPEAGTVD